MSSESETGKIRRQTAAGRSKPARKGNTAAAGQSDWLQVVRFTLAGREFGVDVRYVREIRRAAEVTVTGDGSSTDNGVLNVRGQAVAVMDLRRRWGLPPAESDIKARVIVIEHEHKTYGLLVDAVTEVLRLGQLSLEPKPIPDIPLGADVMCGFYSMDDQNVIILDVAGLVKR
jgi:purine-binding chemotaxis protein CheW